MKTFQKKILVSPFILVCVCMCTYKPKRRATSSVVTSEQLMVLGVLLLMLSMHVFKSFAYICPSLSPLAPLVPYHFVSQGLSLGPGACRVGLADWQ